MRFFSESASDQRLGGDDGSSVQAHLLTPSPTSICFHKSCKCLAHQPKPLPPVTLPLLVWDHSLCKTLKRKPGVLSATSGRKCFLNSLFLDLVRGWQDPRTLHHPSELLLLTQRFWLPCVLLPPVTCTLIQLCSCVNHNVLKYRHIKTSSSSIFKQIGWLSHQPISRKLLLLY